RASGSASRWWPGSPSSWADARGSNRARQGVRRSASTSPTAPGPPPRWAPRGRAQPDVAAPRLASADGGPGGDDRMVHGARADLGGSARRSDAADGVVEPLGVDRGELLPLHQHIILVE